MFERGFLMDSQDECGRSFIDFAKAVWEVKSISESNQRIRQMHKNASRQQRQSVLDRPNSLSNRDLLLTRHRTQKAQNLRTNATTQPYEATLPKPIIGSLVSRLLNKLTANPVM
jgi:hypothetical protein